MMSPMAGALVPLLVWCRVRTRTSLLEDLVGCIHANESTIPSCFPPVAAVIDYLLYMCTYLIVRGVFLYYSQMLLMYCTEMSTLYSAFSCS